MTRYHFDVRNYGRNQEDNDGMDLPDLEAAKRQAIITARTIMSMNIMDGRLILAPSIAITAEHGKVLAYLPFAEAIDTVYTGARERRSPALTSLLDSVSDIFPGLNEPASSNTLMPSAIQPKNLKPREPRHRVKLKGRMRIVGSPVDVNIHNISSRGMLVQAASSPRIGADVEIDCPNQTVAAKVIWVNDQCFGVRTTESVNVEAIIKSVVPCS